MLRSRAAAEREMLVIAKNPDFSTTRGRDGDVSQCRRIAASLACFNGQYFHSPVASAELRVRALALLWKFCPSSPQIVKQHDGQACPAERLNHKRYSRNWLQKLLVSGSMNGFRPSTESLMKRYNVIGAIPRYTGLALRLGIQAHHYPFKPTIRRRIAFHH